MQAKRASLASLDGLIAPKGQATASPEVAAPPAPSPVSPIRPGQDVAAPRPAPAAREAARYKLQLGFRIGVEQHEQLLKLAYERRMKIQTILEQAVTEFLEREG